MGSRLMSITAMNHATGAAELEQGIPVSYAELLRYAHEYESKFGGEAARALYEANGRNWQQAAAACRDILGGGALALMSSSVTQNGGL